MQYYRISKIESSKESGKEDEDVEKFLVRYPASAEKGWRLESSILGVNAHKQLDERCEGHQEKYAGESDMVAVVGFSTLETFELNLNKDTKGYM